jgi:hypothetical protein
MLPETFLVPTNSFLAFMSAPKQRRFSEGRARSSTEIITIF